MSLEIMSSEAISEKKGRELNESTESTHSGR